MLEVQSYTAEREWEADGISVLRATVALPRLSGEPERIARRINRFYQTQGRMFLRYCEGCLFPRAAELYRQALESSTPLPSCTADLSYRVTCLERGILSVHTDTLESIGGGAERFRWGDTWELATGLPLPLGAFFPRHFPIRHTLLKAAEAEIRRQEEAGISRYHDGWRQSLRRTYSADRFFVTPQGVSWFWQMRTVAPAAEGIPTFFLPFSPEGCRWPEPAEELLDALPQKPLL